MKKTLITILATVLICCCVVGGTLAWLMDSTETITNTFTVGNVDIELTETNVVADADGNMSKEFKMVPGNTIAKDPTVKVKAGSEKCYVFVKVVVSNNTHTSGNEYLTVIVGSHWKKLDGVDNVYYYDSVVDTSAETSDMTLSPVLENNQVTVKNTVTKEMMDDLTDTTLPTITVTAYAVQAENMANAAAAWTAGAFTA